MKLQEGVDIHFIKTDKFTTNRINVRFAAPMNRETVAGRSLVANMLEVANQDFPSSQEFRRHLASLYGAKFSTSVSKKGKVHFVDITLSYVNATQLPKHLDLTEALLDVLFASLFRPLKKKGGFDPVIFEIEKKNLLAYLESEIEDNFYHASVEMNKLFFTDEHVQIPKVSQLELVKKENSETAYKALQNMLRLDKIDIFVLGSVNQERVIKKLKTFHFNYRKPILELEYQQEFSPVTREKLERKEARQSILELAYHLQIVYNDVNYIPLIVLNGLLGAFSHSKLFVTIREKKSLAYAIGSSLNIFSGMLTIYAGIDRVNKIQVMKLIGRQLIDIKQGKFTDVELELTKSMLIHSATLAQDKQINLIEQVYNEVNFCERYIDWENWIKAIKQVSKDDIMRASKQIRLQAVYFMEGME